MSDKSLKEIESFVMKELFPKVLQDARNGNRMARALVLETTDVYRFLYLKSRGAFRFSPPTSISNKYAVSLLPVGVDESVWWEQQGASDDG